MDASAQSKPNHPALVCQTGVATKDLGPPSSSPAFGTPAYSNHLQTLPETSKPSSLPLKLPSATLRPLAFRTFTKKHNLTLTSSALESLASFIGRHCGLAWREEGLAERYLDDIAKIWKKNGGGVIVSGEEEDFQRILRTVGNTIEERSTHHNGLNRQLSTVHEVQGPSRKSTTNELLRDSSQGAIQDNLGVTALNLSDSEEDNDCQPQDPRQWLKIVHAFEQPRLSYNWTQKHFEIVGAPPSLLPDPAHKSYFFRHRHHLIHQRLLRHESFQSSATTTQSMGNPHQSSSVSMSAQQACKLTPIANLLGRGGSSHLLLGLLSISPTGDLTISDLSGSVPLDIQHAKPIPKGAAWFTPGMVVLADGVYEEETSVAGPIIGGDGGVGGTIGGKFVGFSIGGPPCERRDVTLGVYSTSGDGKSSAGAGFGWVNFLGVGNERGSGPRMRRLEQKMLKRSPGNAPFEGRGRFVIIGEVDLTNTDTLPALRKILGTYAAEPFDHTPMSFILMGNFVRYAAMTGGGSNGSIEYKEQFDSLASVLSDYPTVLCNSTFIFVPGDNDPWASAFSAGAATVLPKAGIPDIFTTRVKRAFAAANAEVNGVAVIKNDGKAIWSTNPARMTLFGPVHEVVLFRDDVMGRLHRNALKFAPSHVNDMIDLEMEKNPVLNGNSGNPILSQAGQVFEGMETNQTVKAAESHVPATVSSMDLKIARKLVKTILDQGFLSPFPLSTRPILWDYAGALQLYPLPSALVLMDPEAPAFAVTYEGCHVMNPGPLVAHGRRGTAQWMEYNVRTRRGKMRQVMF